MLDENLRSELVLRYQNIIKKFNPDVGKALPENEIYLLAKLYVDSIDLTIKEYISENFKLKHIK
jgi:hypothetical protein